MGENLTQAVSKKSHKGKGKELGDEKKLQDRLAETGIKQKGKKERSKDKAKEPANADRSTMPCIQEDTAGLKPNAKKKRKDSIAIDDYPILRTESDKPSDYDLGVATERKKKRKKDTMDAPKEAPVSSERKGKKEKKGRRQSIDDKAATTPADGEQKERKRRENKYEGDKDGRVEPKKKKRKMEQCDFINPEKDAALNDQARKALVYAYAQFEDPTSWKFNKARQNWLLRNVWSDQSVPDTYLSLASKYLANVQGGVRENLVKTCHAALAPPTAVSPAVADHALLEKADQKSLAVAPAVSGETVKQLRARTLLKLLSASASEGGSEGIL